MFPSLTVLLAVSFYITPNKSRSLKEVLVVNLSIQVGVHPLRIRYALQAKEVYRVIGDIFIKKFRQLQLEIQDKVQTVNIKEQKKQQDLLNLYRGLALPSPLALPSSPQPSLALPSPPQPSLALPNPLSRFIEPLYNSLLEGRHYYLI